MPTDDNTPGGLEERRKVLYLGWWNEASDALSRNGCETTFLVTAADAKVAADHGYVGRTIVVPDPGCLDDGVAALRRASLDVCDFEIVTTEYEPYIIPAAVLAQAYGHKGMPVNTALALRDKYIQKGVIRDAGLPVAATWTLDEITEPHDLAAPGPIVVKPLAGAGTQLTYIVRDQESRERAASDIVASRAQGPWLIEEFVSGHELHMDGVVRDGTVLFMDVCRYLQNVIAIQDGALVGSVVLDPGTHRRLYEWAEELVSGALKALGHTDGVFHMEAFEQEDRLVFSECAGRIGGGMVYETTGAKFGVDLYDEWARAVLHLPTGLAPDRQTSDRPFGWVQLPASPGRVTAIPGADELCTRPGVVAAQVSLKPGDAVPDAAAGSFLRAARVVMTGTSEATLAEEMTDFARWFRDQVRVEP